MSTLSAPRGGAAPPLERRCPWLTATTGQERAIYPHGFTCALRRDRERAPSADELAWFCSNGHFRACPTHRRRLDREKP